MEISPVKFSSQGMTCITFVLVGQTKYWLSFSEIPAKEQPFVAKVCPCALLSSLSPFGIISSAPMPGEKESLRKSPRELDRMLCFILDHPFLMVLTSHHTLNGFLFGILPFHRQKIALLKLDLSLGTRQVFFLFLTHCLKTLWKSLFDR
mgnify:CR=1 FL=1